MANKTKTPLIKVAVFVILTIVISLMVIILSRYDALTLKSEKNASIISSILPNYKRNAYHRGTSTLKVLSRDDFGSTLKSTDDSGSASSLSSCPLETPTPDVNPCSVELTNIPGPDRPICTPTLSPTPSPTSYTDDGCGSGGDCNQNKIKTYCLDKNELVKEFGQDLLFMPKGCLLFLSKERCRIYGIDYSNQTIEGLLIDRTTLLNYPRNPKNSTEAVEICEIRHEVEHSWDGISCPRCRTEKKAFTASISCLSSFYNRYCSPEGRKWPNNECNYLQGVMVMHELAFNMNNCICSKTNAGTKNPSESVCCECENACKSNPKCKARGQAACNQVCKVLRDDYCIRQTVN